MQAEELLLQQKDVDNLYILVPGRQSTRQTAGFDIQAFVCNGILTLVKTSGTLAFSEL